MCVRFLKKCIRFLKSGLEELFPVPFYLYNSRKLKKRAQCADLLKKRAEYAHYPELPLDQLSARLNEERSRAVALDEKTFKMSLSLTIGLTVVGTTSAVLVTGTKPAWLAYAVAVLIGLGVFYVLTGGFVALGSLRTQQSFGYGTQPLLLTEDERIALFADSLARQEIANQVRHLRNETAFQLLRNGFALLFLGLLLFGISKAFAFGAESTPALLVLT